MKPRSTKPLKGNKYFTRKASGGYSTCIKGYPTDACDVLSNCVGYANGAFNELVGAGYEKYPLHTNAENFIERAIALKLKVQYEPVEGGIMVWQQGGLSRSDGAGHVAFVYDHLPGSNVVKTSESDYGGRAFYTATRQRGSGNWGAGAGYKYRGCIVNPNYTRPKPPAPKPPAPKPETSLTREELTQLVRRTIRGDFGNGEARKKALGNNYAKVQAQVNLNIKYGTTRWNNIKLY